MPSLCNTRRCSFRREKPAKAGTSVTESKSVCTVTLQLLFSGVLSCTSGIPVYHEQGVCGGDRDWVQWAFMKTSKDDDGDGACIVNLAPRICSKLMSNNFGQWPSQGKYFNVMTVKPWCVAFSIAARKDLSTGSKFLVQVLQEG